MNQIILKRWLAALRSKIYRQTTDVLHNKNGYCCLGVLCDLYLKDHGENWVATVDRPDVYQIRATYGTLPFEVMRWAGLVEVNPTVKYVDELVTLSILNDSTKLPFDEIADLIEKEYTQ